MTHGFVKHITVCGSGLAANMCAMALAHILPSDIDITLVEDVASAKADILYGHVTAPTIYGFLNKIGISEPELLLNTNTSFSFGTEYRSWGNLQNPWIQSFHLPLLTLGGVSFHQFITQRYRNGIADFDLSPYLISVQAAIAGTFAHPPSQQNIPLARAESGYHFSPHSWAHMFSQHVTNSRIKKISAQVSKVNREGRRIKSLSLSNGMTVTADLFIDCTGPDGRLIQSTSNNIIPERTICAIESSAKTDTLETVCRVVTGTDFGWTSETPLQGEVLKLTVYDPIQEQLPLNTDLANQVSIQVDLGHVTKAWDGNCVAVGLASARLDPLTPAPIMLLQRDIERLLELVPITEKMNIEAREYNRRFKQDYLHGTMFQRTLFDVQNPPTTPYFTAASKQPIHKKLATKLSQFKSRGLLIQYDNELFNEQDWMMLHYGMRRTPERYDPLVGRVPEAHVDKTLTQMRIAIKSMADKMPSHQAYMTKFLAYLKDKHA